MSKRRQGDDSGESLVELMLTILIVGVCAVAIGSGIALSVKMSDVHRKQALAGEFLHNYAETLQSATYQSCTSTTPNYAAGLPTPTGSGSWTVSQAAISYWNGTAFNGTCQNPDRLQQVTLRLVGDSGLVNESVVVVLRNSA